MVIMRLRFLIFLFVSSLTWSTYAQADSPLQTGLASDIEIVCSYDRPGGMSGNVLLQTGQTQIHTDIEEVGHGEQEDIDDWIIEKAGYDVAGWINSYLARYKIKKGYISIMERTTESPLVVSMAVVYVVNSSIDKIESKVLFLGLGSSSERAGNLTCEIHSSK